MKNLRLWHQIAWISNWFLSLAPCKTLGNLLKLFQILKDDALKVLHSICQQIWKTQQWPQDWKRSVFGGAKMAEE